MIKEKTIGIIAALLIAATATAATSCAENKAEITQKNYVLSGDKVYDTNGEAANVEAGFVSIDGNVYYAVDNTIVKGLHVIDGRICDFGNDGKLDSDARIYDYEFVKIDGSTYYAIQNRVVINGCVIDGRAFEFSADGKITSAPEGIVSSHGKGYFFKNNNILLDHSVLVNGVYLSFDGDGVMREELPDGIITEIESEKYYLEKGVVYRGGFLLYDGKIYYFDSESGKMLKDCEVDGYKLGSDGAVYNPTGEKLLFDYNRSKYLITENKALLARTLDGTVYSSNASQGFSSLGNSPLENAVCTVEISGETYEAETSADGKFSFGYVPDGDYVLNASKEDYVSASVEIESGSDKTVSVVIEKNLSVTLGGIVHEIVYNEKTEKILSGVSITLKRTSGDGVWTKTATTDENGNYGFSDLTSGIYELTAAKNGYFPLKQIIAVLPSDAPNYENVALDMAPALEYSDKFEQGGASGTITDKTTGKGIAGLTVYVIENYNDVSTSKIAEVTTDENGNYEISDLKQGYYTLLIVDNRKLESGEAHYSSARLYVKVYGFGWACPDQNLAI